MASVKHSLHHSVGHINTSSRSLIKYADGDKRDDESQTYSSFTKQKLNTDESPIGTKKKFNNKLLLKYKPGEYTMIPQGIGPKKSPSSKKFKSVSPAGVGIRVLHSSPSPTSLSPRAVDGAVN